MNTHPIKVAILDPHAVIREGLREILRDLDGIDIVGEYSHVSDAIVEPAVVDADVIIAEPSAESGADLDGSVRAVSALRHASSSEILVYSCIEDSRSIRDLLRAGACGFLPKCAEKADFFDAMGAVSGHKVWLHPLVQRALMDSARWSGTGVEGLTGRERSILDLLCEGRANKDISRRLGLSEGTIKCYVSRIISKFGLADRTQVALYAVHHGLVDLPDRNGGQFMFASN